MEVLWEHIEWILSFAAIVVGSIYVPIRNKNKERKEKEYQQTISAIWKKLDKTADDLSNNYYTKQDCDSKMKHRIEKAAMKQTIEVLKDKVSNSEDR